MAVLSADYPAVAAERGVTIQSFAFAPGRLTVNAGDTVTWTNRDGATHTTTATDRAWDHTLAPGQSAAVTLTRPGDFAYFCALHSYMTGTITVVANGDVPSAPATLASGAASATARYVITVGGDLSVGYRGHDTGGVHLFCTETIAPQLVTPEAVCLLRP